MHADRAPIALLVEIEGVLAETGAARRASLADALAERGLTLSEAALARAADGHAPAVAAALAADELTRDPTTPRLDTVDVDLLALAATRAFTERASRGVSLVPDAREALLALASRVVFAVVTRAPAHVAEQILALAGLDAVVRAVVAAEQVAAPKPSPAGHLRALHRLARLRPFAAERAVALEDGADGLTAARAAGLLALGVGRGAHDATEDRPWVASVADLTYDALVDLVDTRGVRGT